MKVIVAGGSGFLGRALSGALRAAGHDVVVLTRSPQGAAAAPGRQTPAPGTVEAAWTPDGSTGPWAAAIEGADAVVNLAGQSIGEGRWTAARKEAIAQSRLLATRSLVSAINLSRSRPPVFVSASAQAYYGSRGDESLSEEAGPGHDFLAGVCVAWEAEARKVHDTVRLVLLRTGIVLDAGNGALPRMLTPFRLFAGGPLGSGRQFMSWIHRDDWVGMAEWAIEQAAVRGGVNVCAPGAVTNHDFSAAIGRALHRPSLLPAPAFALRLVLGEMADALLLTSTRMVPARALSLGYHFRFGDLDAALADLLGR